MKEQRLEHSRLIKAFSPGSKTNSITVYSDAAAQPPFGTVSVWGRVQTWLDLNVDLNTVLMPVACTQTQLIRCVKQQHKDQNNTNV